MSQHARLLKTIQTIQTINILTCDNKPLDYFIKCLFSRKGVDNDIFLLLSVIYEVNKYNWKPTHMRNTVKKLGSSHLCPSNMTSEVHEQTN